MIHRSWLRVESWSSASLRPRDRARLRRRLLRPLPELLEERTLLSTLVALTRDDRLVSFDSSLPGIILNDVAITGLLSNDGISTIAVRPSNGELYGLGVNHLYSLDPTTGTATLIGSPTNSLGLYSEESGVPASFDPVSDDLRAVTDLEGDVLINPSTGTVIPYMVGPRVTPRPTPEYGMGDVNFGQYPEINSLAYSATVAGASTLYAIDMRQEELSTLGGHGGQPSPDSGELFSVFATRSWNTFTIDEATNLAYATIVDDNATGGTTNNLEAINLATGSANVLGAIGAKPDSFRWPLSVLQRLDRPCRSPMPWSPRMQPDR